jgi:hypothetical protein
MAEVEAAADVDVVELDKEELRVYQWRQFRFLKLGFDSGQAQILAMNGADWHTAQRLLANGCPFVLAFELLS